MHTISYHKLKHMPVLQRPPIQFTYSSFRIVMQLGREEDRKMLRVEEPIRLTLSTVMPSRCLKSFLACQSQQSTPIFMKHVSSHLFNLFLENGSFMYKALRKTITHRRLVTQIDWSKYLCGVNLSVKTDWATLAMVFNWWQNYCVSTKQIQAAIKLQFKIWEDAKIVC